MKLGNVNTDCLILKGDGETVRRDEQGIPTSFRVLKPGIVDLTIDGTPIRGQITSEDIAAILDYHRMKGEQIPVDCEHLLSVLADMRGVDEAELLKNEPLLAEKAAAGFVTLTEIDGELWATVDKWSARARELLGSAGDAMYNYFSPVFRGLKNGPLRITSFALTNTPAINNLDALAASAERTIAQLAAANQTRGVGSMKIIAKLCELLGLDAAAFTGEGNGLEPLLQAAAEQVESLKAASGRFVGAVKDAMNLTDAPAVDVAIGLIGTLALQAKNDAQALSDARTKIAGFEKAEKARLIERLKTEGKLAEAQVPWAEQQDMAALTEYAKVAPVVVPISRVTPADAGRAAGDNRLAMSDAAAAVARNCGLDPKKVAEVNKLKV